MVTSSNIADTFNALIIGKIYATGRGLVTRHESAPPPPSLATKT
jgi:hypothetical protein